jgi:hypothetical protein
VCFLIDSAAHFVERLPLRNFNLPRLTSRITGVVTLHKSLDDLPALKDYRRTFHRAPRLYPDIASLTASGSLLNLGWCLRIILKPNGVQRGYRRQRCRGQLGHPRVLSARRPSGQTLVEAEQKSGKGGARARQLVRAGRR